MRFIRRLLHRKHEHVAHKYKDFVVEVCWCGDYFKRALELDDIIALLWTNATMAMASTVDNAIMSSVPPAATINAL